MDDDLPGYLLTTKIGTQPPFLLVHQPVLGGPHQQILGKLLSLEKDIVDIGLAVADIDHPRVLPSDAVNAPSSPG